MNTFFPLTTLETKKPIELLAKCGQCKLCKGDIQSPKIQIRGKGQKEILIVTEFPGKDDDAAGKFLSGQSFSANFLKPILGRFGIDLVRDCWITGALICKPSGVFRDYSDKVPLCRPNLLKEIRRLKPKVIILLGQLAVKSLIGHLWKENCGSVWKWIGWEIPDQTFNTWICPTFNPRILEDKDDPVLKRMITKHIEKAIKHTKRPWRESPDYKSHVEIVYNEGDAANAIRTMIKDGRSIAFDYETNCLKPDSERSRIICCSASNGKKTIVYPWHGKAIDATREMVRSPVGKIASNMKFEDRWTRVHLKTPVNNWEWDTMLAAHVIDNRPEITSIKFQAFVKLGQPLYNNSVDEFLKADDDGGNSINRITECDRESLMLYCGLDSLLEWKVARIQQRELGFRNE